jgi:Zn-dependent protease with chaperone function
MGRWWLTLCLLAGLGQGHAEDIGSVLQRSQALRLASFRVADPASPGARVLQRSFETLRRALPAPLPGVELRVIDGPVIAETLLGRVVVAHRSLAELSEGERLFVLAHELGHVVHGDWDALGRVYRRWIPDDVRPELTDRVGPALGREASALVRRQEFDADTFALELLQRLGHGPETAVSAFMRLGITQDTATHPGTLRRIAALRERVALMQ